MSLEFLLPDIGEGLTEAEIIRWLVRVGDVIKEDQPFVEIQTDKAITEMPAPGSGVVTGLGGDEGGMLHVGDMLLTIDDGLAERSVIGGAHGTDHAALAAAASDNPTPFPAAALTPGLVAAAPDAPPVPIGRPLATPATRGLARRLGVTMSAIRGTGPGGRITDADVQATATGSTTPAPNTTAGTPPQRIAMAAPSVAAPVGDDQRVAFRGIRRRTAETLTAAWQNVPHVSSFAEIDVHDLFAVRAQLKPVASARGIDLTLTAFLVKATALALREVPEMNASLDLAAEQIILRANRNIGLAVDTPDGLILPVLRNPDTRALFEVAAELTSLTGAARTRKLDLASMTGSTFTISNYGPLGGWFGTSLVRNGEVGVLGFGPAIEKPVVRDGQIVIRRIMVTNAGADHRVVDGQQIIAFIQAVKRLLEQPARLLVEA